MANISYTAIRRGQFVALREGDTYRLARVVKASAAGKVRSTVHPGDWDASERGVGVRIDTRDRQQECSALDARHNARMHTATKGLTRADLTYPTKRELQLDVLRMLGYEESELVDAGIAMRGGKSIAEYTH